MVDAYTLEQGSKGLDSETIDAMVKQIQLRSFKFKQAVSIVPTSSLDSTFFREDPTILSAHATAPIEGVPFGASFPTASPKLQALSSRVIAFKLEDNIPWEIIKGAVIDIQARTIIKLTEGVVKAVDDYILGQLSETPSNGSPLTEFNFAQTLQIQSYSISSDRYWNGSSGAIVDDLGAAQQLIGDKFYDNGNTLTFVSARDRRSIVKYLHDKGAQYNTLGEDMALNGRIARVAGTTLVETPSIPASYSLMVVPKICATYKEFESLKSATTTDKFKSLNIRVIEEGAIELTDPLAVVVIRGTQGMDGL